MNDHTGNGSTAAGDTTWQQFENKVLRDGKWVARDDRKRPLVAVCMPHGVMIEGPTTWCLFGLGVQTSSADLMACGRMGADPAHGRNEAVKLSVEAGADYILLLDQDMMFPPEALDRLLAHDVDIVGCDYRGRMFPFTQIGVPEPDYQTQTSGLAKYMMWGLGFVLIKRRVFFQIPRPWFARAYDASGIETEDYWFCERARRTGLTIWCDLDLTKEIHHIGHQPVPWDIQFPKTGDKPSDVP